MRLGAHPCEAINSCRMLVFVLLGMCRRCCADENKMRCTEEENCANWFLLGVKKACSISRSLCARNNNMCLHYCLENAVYIKKKRYICWKIAHCLKGARAHRKAHIQSERIKCVTNSCDGQRLNIFYASYTKHICAMI